MAAYRKGVPLRQSSTSFRVEDGTTCRMPSPVPGPLRGESDFGRTGLRSRVEHSSPRAGSTATLQASPV